MTVARCMKAVGLTALVGLVWLGSVAESRGQGTIQFPGGGRYLTDSPFLVVLEAAEGSYFTKTTKVYAAEFTPFEPPVAGEPALTFQVVRAAPFDQIQEGRYRKMAVQVELASNAKAMNPGDNYLKYCGELRLVYRMAVANAEAAAGAPAAGVSGPGTIEPMPDPCPPVAGPRTPPATSVMITLPPLVSSVAQPIVIPNGCVPVSEQTVVYPSPQMMILQLVPSKASPSTSQ
jgi:hypothetical protein